MFKALFAAALVSLFASSAFAGGYGDAGCGLGSIVFGSKKGFVQIFAATTNGTFGSQTFGITTGTSNCSGLGKSATAFIDANKVSLNNDIARGQGETLAALAEIYGVKNVSEMGRTLKADYKSIFAASDAAKIEARIRKTLTDRKLM